MHGLCRKRAAAVGEQDQRAINQNGGKTSHESSRKQRKVVEKLERHPGAQLGLAHFLSGWQGVGHPDNVAVLDMKR